MKLLYEFIPRLDFLSFAGEIKDLVDGWNITDSAGGRPAPSATAVACILKTKYPERITIPMLITNYKGPVEISALALACEAVGIDGVVIDPGDAPEYGYLIRTWKDGSCEILKDPDEINRYRLSTGPAEEVRDFLREKIKINLNFGCLLTARRPVEDSLFRIRDDWDFCFFLRLQKESLSKLKEIASECQHLGKPIYPYFIVETPKNKKILERIGWPATATLDDAEEFVEDLKNVVDGIIASCLGDRKADIELLKKFQRFRRR